MSVEEHQNKVLDGLLLSVNEHVVVQLHIVSRKCTVKWTIDLNC